MSSTISFTKEGHDIFRRFLLNIDARKGDIKCTRSGCKRNCILMQRLNGLKRVMADRSTWQGMENKELCGGSQNPSLENAKTQQMIREKLFNESAREKEG
jgi:hypothetical protein